MSDLCDFLKYVVVITLLSVMHGCSADVQRVCPTQGAEVVTEYAVDYWASRGHAVMVSNDSECTVRVRLADRRVDGSEWPEGQYGEHYLPLSSEPSHTFQGEIRLRRDYWRQISKAQQRFVLTHELGHAWFLEHSTGVMQERVPESAEEAALILNQP